MKGPVVIMTSFGGQWLRSMRWVRIVVVFYYYDIFLMTLKSPGRLAQKVTTRYLGAPLIQRNPFPLIGSTDSILEIEKIWQIFL